MEKTLLIVPFKISASLGAGVVAVVTQQLPNDGDFEIREVRTTGTSNIFITATVNNAIVTQLASWNAGLIGAGQNGLKLFDPWILARNSTIQMQYENLTGGAVSAFELQLIGYKIWKSPI